MSAITARDFDRPITDPTASLAQRLGDAMRFPVGSVPGARDYGSHLVDAIDRNIGTATPTLVYKAIAEAIRNPANGLLDLELQSVEIVGWQDNQLQLSVRAHFQGEAIAVPVIL